LNAGKKDYGAIGNAASNQLIAFTWLYEVFSNAWKAWNERWHAV